MILHIESEEDLKHISFLVSREMIDVIHASLPNNMDPSEGFIEMFIIAAKNSFNLTTPVTSIDCTEEDIQ